LIIPFYNEVERFDLRKLIELSKISDGLIDIYLINDASKDDLPEKLSSLIQNQKLKNVFLLTSEKNLGKANAIRFGFNSIPNLTASYKFFGFTDADFSSPPNEIMEVARIASKNGFEFNFGVRVSTEQNIIKTSRFRFLQGRLFSLLVKLVLGSSISDSQCGLKYMKVTKNVEEIFQKEFMNRWLIDLEILCRANKLNRIKVCEVILKEWVHVGNSKTKFSDLPKVMGDIMKLRLNYGTLRNVERQIINVR
jgi:hypothetical protein